MHLCEYLRKCIEDIRLYEIAISVNDKKRAIDIYENLNLGGKSLSVFDLILAKASRHTQEKGNLFTQIVDDIERDHRAVSYTHLDVYKRQHIYAAIRTLRQEKIYPAPIPYVRQASVHPVVREQMPAHRYTGAKAAKMCIRDRTDVP